MITEALSPPPPDQVGFLSIKLLLANSRSLFSLGVVENVFQSRVFQENNLAVELMFSLPS